MSAGAWKSKRSPWPSRRANSQTISQSRRASPAGELIAPLAVLARALPVALPGDRRVAAAGLPDLPGREHEVDAREHVLDAVRVVLDAAGVQQHRPRGLHPQLRRLDDARGRNANETLDRLGRAIGDRLAH